MLFTGGRRRRWSITGYENNSDIAPDLPNGSRRFPSIHLRHREIGEDEIKRTTPQNLDGLLSAARQFHLVIHRDQHLRECLAHRRLVVHNENSQTTSFDG